MRSASPPDLSNEITSFAGNLIAVLVSPVWIILSAIEKSPVAPDAFEAVPVTLPVNAPTNVVAVSIPVTTAPVFVVSNFLFPA